MNSAIKSFGMVVSALAMNYAIQAQEGTLGGVPADLSSRKARKDFEKNLSRNPSAFYAVDSLYAKTLKAKIKSQPLYDSAYHVVGYVQTTEFGRYLDDGLTVNMRERREFRDLDGDGYGDPEEIRNMIVDMELVQEVEINPNTPVSQKKEDVISRFKLEYTHDLNDKTQETTRAVGWNSLAVPFTSWGARAPGDYNTSRLTAFRQFLGNVDISNPDKLFVSSVDMRTRLQRIQEDIDRIPKVTSDSKIAQKAGNNWSF